MATKPSTKSKKTTARPAAVNVTEAKPLARSWRLDASRNLSPQALLAEFFGTLVLVSSVVFTSGDAFFTGLTLVVVALGIFGISGAHVNPAVTFGLWTLRKIKASRMFLYWVAQFLGALAAILLIHLFSGEKFALSLGSFWAFDAKIFFSELIGMAVFVFGLVAITSRSQNESSKAVGIGLSLFLGLVMATGLLSQAVSADSSSTTTTDTSTSRLQKVNSVALNPAVALALTEKDASTSSLTGATSTATLPSRLTIEIILGTFIGSAIGANLYGLLATRRDEV